MLDPVKKKIIGVGSGEEEDANRRRKESPRRDGLLRQRTGGSRDGLFRRGRIERPFYRERRVIGRRQLDGRRRRSAETAEDCSQHTGKILDVVGAEKERREWSCSRVWGSYCLSFLFSADCFFLD